MINPQIGEKVLDLAAGTGGVSIGIAAELAGHSRLETTQKHYTSTDNAAVVQDATAKIKAADDARIDQWPDTIE